MEQDYEQKIYYDNRCLYWYWTLPMLLPDRVLDQLIKKKIWAPIIYLSFQ